MRGARVVFGAALSLGADGAAEGAGGASAGESGFATTGCCTFSLAPSLARIGGPCAMVRLKAASTPLRRRSSSWTRAPSLARIGSPFTMVRLKAASTPLRRRSSSWTSLLVREARTIATIDSTTGATIRRGPIRKKIKSIPAPSFGATCGRGGGSWFSWVENF